MKLYKNEKGFMIITFIVTIIVILIVIGVVFFLPQTKLTIEKMTEHTQKHQEISKNITETQNVMTNEIEGKWGIGENDGSVPAN